MQANLLECSACNQLYNLSDRFPRTLNLCGHSICSFCLTRRFNSQRFECPLCNKSFYPKKSLEETLDTFPASDAMIEYIRANLPSSEIELSFKTNKKPHIQINQ